MSHTLATPTATSALRGWFARAWADPDSRSNLVGLAAVLLFFLVWLILWIVDPPIFRYDPSDLAREQNTAREFNIELTPETFAKQPPKPALPNKFVETNPEAPENIPDKTMNFGAQNQQVAQEKPTPDGKSDRPATEGQKDFENTQIVSGSLTQPRELPPPVPATVETPPVETPPVTQQKAEKMPLPGVEKFEGENKTGLGGSIAKRVENARISPDKQEGTKVEQDVDGPPSVMPTIDRNKPRPRQQIAKQQQVRPAILSENKVGTSNVGVIAHTALMTTYGQYLQRIIETVQIQWERLIIEQRAYPPIGSTVTVKFILDSEGKIARIVNVETSATQTASNACVSAITDRSPYGPWDEGMKAILGEQQELVFTFHYQ
jgi:hypothetical protein